MLTLAEADSELQRLVMLKRNPMPTSNSHKLGDEVRFSSSQRSNYKKSPPIVWICNLIIESSNYNFELVLLQTNYVAIGECSQRNQSMKLIVTIVAILACFTCRAAVPIRILAWNIESGGSDTQVIINQLKTEMPKYDILAVSEVASNAIEPIAKALGWKHFGGSRGGEDRLILAWSDRFKAAEQLEVSNSLRDTASLPAICQSSTSSWRTTPLTCS
jgi:hypothetical protein